MNKKQKEYIASYKFEKSLLLIGDVGVGKTFLMNFLEKQILKGKRRNEAGIDCYWIDDGEFREKMTAGHIILKPIESSASITTYPLEMMIRSKVLFYDDLGASENVSKSQVTKFKYILDERIKKGLPTIFSTNLSPKEINDLYGERIKSRLFLNTTVFEMKGEDRRKDNTEFI